MPQAMLSSAERAPTPTMRSMKMRLPVMRVWTSFSTCRTSAKALRTLMPKPSGRSALTPPTRHVLHELPEELAGLDHVEEDGEGAQLHGGGAHAGQVVADPRDLAHDHADVLAPLRDLDARSEEHTSE